MTTERVTKFNEKMR